MIVLPSGRKAGITNIRARFHALRLNRTISADTPRKDLYRLIDIISSPDEYHYLPGGSNYLFSGHTLDELPGLRQWSDADRRVFGDWIKQAAQVAEIEQVRRRIPDDFPLAAWEFSHTDRLYSGLQRRIQALDMKQASPMQWKKTLLNFQRKGLRAEELEWSGLIFFLDKSQQQGVAGVSRDELLQKIDFAIIQPCLNHELEVASHGHLEFVELTQSKSKNRLGSIQKINQPGEVCVLRYADTLHFYKVGHLMRVNAKMEWTRSKRWFALDTIGNLIACPLTGESFFIDQNAAFRVASEHALQHVGVPASYRHCNRYEHKSLCGGSHYREWLMTLPNYPISYHNKHYYERNLLLHFRSKERYDHLGRRLLFIEELQSDWHQSGAMHGYQTHWPGHIPPAPFRKEWVGLALKMVLIHAAKEGYEGIAWARGEVQEAHYKQTLVTVRRLYDEQIPGYLTRLCSDWGGSIGHTRITTKEPRLHISRQMDKWFVTDPNGSFSTRAKDSQQEAIQIMARHSKKIDLEVPVLLLDKRLRDCILIHGFPLFGERQV